MTTEILKTILEEENCACVIYNHDKIVICRGRGISDLFWYVENDIEFLRGAVVADRIVGKGAAALMTLGNVAEVFTYTISQSAAEFLKSHNVRFSADKTVPIIINRNGTGQCPVEALTAQCTSAKECLPLIKDFIYSKK